MLSPHPTSTDLLADTALAATGGGTLVAVDVHSARSGCASAIVLTGGDLLRVELDGLLGIATVTSATAGACEPVRCSALAA